jgi:hypothetical protein
MSEEGEQYESLKVCIRIEAVLLVTTGCGRWSLVEGVIRAVHQRILTEHGSHLCFRYRERRGDVSRGVELGCGIFEV